MKETREVFNAMKIKRTMNRETSAQRLRDAGIEFTSNNFGSHILIGDQWEFWPGPGRFKHRTLPIEGRGVRNLINHIKESK